MKLDYVARETTTNLRRNITLTFAAIVTVAVSLALFGSTLLVRQGVDNVSARWEEGIELIVFLQRNITEEQQTAIEDLLESNPEVADYRFVDVEASHREAERLFARNAAMMERLAADPEMIPPSFRIVPQTKEADVIESLRQQFVSQPGVRSAVGESDSVKTVRGVSNFSQRAMLVVAVGLLVAALMLILNAIRMAMFARRREIEVMKLVGATNWFIRVPFMLEGIVQGVVGAFVALGAVWALDSAMDRAAQNADYQAIMGGFVASSSEFTVTAIIVVVLGIVIGAAGSGWALSRFLKV